MPGEAALLVPGTLCDAALWAGVGLSAGTRVVDTVRGDSLADAAARVMAAAPAGERVHLVGFSLGAIVAFEVLRRFPGRLARLTLISANPHAPTPAQLGTWAHHEAQVRAGDFDGLATTIAAGAGSHRGLVLDMARRVGPEVYLEQLALLRARPDSRPDVAAYAGPLALLVGREDAVTPPHLSEDLRSLAPQAHVRVVPGAGHHLPLDAPAEVAAALHSPVSA